MLPDNENEWHLLVFVINNIFYVPCNSSLKNVGFLGEQWVYEKNVLAFFSSTLILLVSFSLFL